MNAISTDRIGAIRRFNRFHTRKVGALDASLLDSGFALPEARLIYELAQQPGITAAALARDLGLDPGYLSRLLRSLTARGLIQRAPAPDDRRQGLLSLTPAGAAVFAALDARSSADAAAWLTGLTDAEQERLTGALSLVEHLLGAAPAGPAPVVLRPPRPGDMGLVVASQGRAYAEDYGWDWTYEALVAEIVARYVRSHDPASDTCVIAEQGGRFVGSVFVVREDATTARLRLLAVEKIARGQGLGRLLVEEAIRFARGAGYREMVLWTQDCLTAAGAIYRKAGFRLEKQEPHTSFGKDLVGQTYRLKFSVG